MQIVMFYHSLLSDWNHGNAHFLRGVVTELKSRGHNVIVYEPVDAWSLCNLITEHGGEPIRGFRRVYPGLESIRYDTTNINLNEALDDADLVIVHEWNEHELVSNIGKHRAKVGGYRLLFHDTHHRSVTDSSSMAAYDLTHYDGVLAFGSVIRDLYLSNGWTKRAWTWHEAADTRVFRPMRDGAVEGDVVWVGNWGDDERTDELRTYLLEPVHELGAKTRIYGVRYPDHARKTLKNMGIDYAGWLPNYDVPKVFGRYKATVHVPRRPYTRALPGIPTIRVFEALACEIPLVSAPWDDIEGLFTPGKDFLVARDGNEMKEHLGMLMNDQKTARALAEHGRRTVLARHTCSHRVDELLHIYEELEAGD
ncbi:MAG: glycosyltransferase [Armatimonadota bacterium]|nr:glycosyltransferase [bacterium]